MKRIIPKLYSGEFNKIILILAILHYSMGFMSAQNFYKEERVIPPNPIASSLLLYKDIPVSYGSGVPDVSIPIFTIQIGDFSLPIELKYHIRSLKPQNCISNVALGWTLHYGGNITRTVNGKPDEFAGFFETLPSDLGNGNDVLLRDLYDPAIVSYDSEKDIFTYSLNGINGEFIISDTVIQISKRPYKSVINGRGQQGIDGFDIITDKGEIFKFGYGNYETTGQDQWTVNTTWNIKQICLPAGQKIDFIYEDINVYQIVNIIQHLYINDLQQGYLIGNMNYKTIELCDIPRIDFPVYDVTYRDIHEKNIKTIYFPNGKVEFNLSSDKKTINSIDVYNGSERLKSYEFVLDSTKYMGNMNLLRRIQIRDGSGQFVNEYKFEYYNEGIVGLNANTDFWGYYNGGDTYGGIVPYNQYHAYIGTRIFDCPYKEDQILTTGRSKDPSLYFSLTNVLRKIIYPTNGYTEFVYGLNTWKGVNGVEIQGNGLRVEQISTTDCFGHSEIKTFQYVPYQKPYVYSGISDFAKTTYNVGLDIIPVPNAELPYLGIYRRVDYSSTTPFRDRNLAEIQYSIVTENIGPGNGKNVYYFNYENNHEWFNFGQMFPANTQYIGAHMYIKTYKGWDNGNLVMKNIFDNNNKLIKTITYNYIYNYNTTIKNTRVIKICNYIDPYDQSWYENDITRRELWQSWNNLSDLPPVYGYYNYNIVSGWVEKISETETLYLDDKPITKTTNYEYSGAEKYFPSDEIVSNSDSSQIIIKKIYPYDLQIPPYAEMTSQNIISPSIVQKEYRNSKFIKADSVVYSKWFTTFYKPIEVFTRTSTQTDYELRLNYSYDDKGNVQSIRKENDINTVYIWGYNKSYPVAEIKNATYNEVDSINPNISLLEAGNQSEQQRIRQALPNSMITFYTYKPLIGMTSQTDPNGITTYYEYDSFGRLKLIRDHDGRILKTYEYNYKK